jgi:hypothetical protein
MTDPAAISSDALSVPRSGAASAVVPPPVQIPKGRAAPPPKVVPTAEPIVEVAQRRIRAHATALGNWLRRRADWIGGRNSTRSSFIASAIVHAVLLIVLGLLSIVETTKPGALAFLVAEITEGGGSLSQLEQQSSDELAAFAVTAITTNESHDTQRFETPDERKRVELQREQARSDFNPIGLVPAGSLWHSVGSGLAHPLDGRHPDKRAALVKSEGGTRESEQAVERGLRWLQAHQRTNGSWHFDHQKGPCSGLCRNPGSIGSTTAATALALMPFLSAGHTHRSGEYQQVVEAGLHYLRGRMLSTSEGGDFQEGTMYAQGLTAIVLCEAAAMTGDKVLAGAGQAALDFIVYAQDKNGGGWRYTPGQPGDMTVTGWQLMALKSGQISYLRVPTDTINRATRFLDFAQSADGAYYGYLGSGQEPTSTAVGLLARMYTGWRREHSAMTRGIQYLSRLGPSKNDMYFNYYATQVMHHYGGVDWIEWNSKMRDSLIASQAREGHESGSWYFDDNHQSGAKGGRLYNTAMAIMTLEVYYRYLPLYGQRAVAN